MEKKPLILTLIRLALLGLWMPVAVDKLWNLSGFHSTLLRQPFPDWWADVLFWLLPLLELLAAVLIAWPKNPKRVRQGLYLSTTLLLGFTLFILLGVLGWYDKRPCGCGSVISGLSWEQHLWFNIGFLLISILGLWFTWPDGSLGKNSPHNSLSSRRQEGSLFVRILNYKTVVSLIKTHFPRMFALFRRRAVPLQRKMGEA